MDSLHKDVPVLPDQQELILVIYMQTRDVVWKTYQERYISGMDGERENQRNPCCQIDLMMMVMMMIYIYLYMVDFDESDKMIKISGKWKSR